MFDSIALSGSPASSPQFFTVDSFKGEGEQVVVVEPLNLELLNRSGATWRGQVDRFERSAAIQRLERFEQHPMLEGLRRKESPTSIDLLSISWKELSKTRTAWS